MIFRTESLSAGSAGAPAAAIVKAAANAVGVVLARLTGHGGRHTAHTLTLSDHDLRDIGLGHHAAGQPIPYDPLDLIPRGNFFGHRHRR